MVFFIKISMCTVGPYAYFFQNIYTVGLYAYGLPSFKRLSRLQKYLTDQRYSNLKYIKKKLIIAIVQFRNKLIQTGTVIFLLSRRCRIPSRCHVAGSTEGQQPKIHALLNYELLHLQTYLFEARRNWIVCSGQCNDRSNSSPRLDQFISKLYNCDNYLTHNVILVLKWHLLKLYLVSKLMMVFV
jgi:hypothetical protein